MHYVPSCAPLNIYWPIYWVPRKPRAHRTGFPRFLTHGPFYECRGLLPRASYRCRFYLPRLIGAGYPSYVIASVCEKLLRTVKNNEKRTCISSENKEQKEYCLVLIYWLVFFLVGPVALTITYIGMYYRQKQLNSLESFYRCSSDLQKSDMSPFLRIEPISAILIS